MQVLPGELIALYGKKVAYVKALDQHGVPFFVSEFEENMTSFEQLELQLETFVENLLFD